MKRQDLLSALEIVKPGLATKEILEQSTAFAFMGNRVTTFNDEISISTPVPGLNLTGAIRAEELFALLQKLKKDEIEIEIGEGELLLKSGRAKAGIRLQSEIKLPLEEVGKHGDWHPVPEKLKEGLQFTIPTTGKNLSNSALTCIHIRQDGYLESSDNFRITQYKVADKIPLKPLLFPAASASHLIKYNVVQMGESKGWIHFQTKSDGTIISCRTYEGEFPNTDKFFTVEGVKFELPRTLDELLTRAQIFSARQQSESNEVEIRLENNRIKVRGQNEYGWFEETANIKYDKTATSFTINPLHLKAIVESVHNCVLGKNCLLFQGENWRHVVALKA